MSALLTRRLTTPRSAASALFVACGVACAAACTSSDPAAPATPPAHGGVSGVVTDLAAAGPPIGGPGSEVYLFRTADTPRKSEAVRHAPVTGGPGTFHFALDSVPPGRYYLQACLQIGHGPSCAPYTRYLGGAPEAIDVRAGAVTQIAVLF